MKGWEIFIHSVRLVFSNLGAAFQISLVPYAISGLAFLFLGAQAISIMESASPEELAAADGGLWLNLIIYGIVAILMSLWIAVAWHRYVLLEEYPTGWIPSFHSSEIGGYFIKGLLLGFIIFGAALLFSISVGLILLPILGPFFPFLVIALATYLFYRFCPVLPAVAVGHPMTFGTAWEATKGNGGAIAMLVLLVVLLSMLLEVPNMIGGSDTVIGIIYSLVVSWIMTLVGSSVLTTFYGHFVEGRAID